MKNRSPRTLRRETQRLEHKRERAITRTALGGGHSRDAYTDRGHRKIGAPLVDERSQQSQRPRSQPKKAPELCPERERAPHEYLEERTPVTLKRDRWSFRKRRYERQHASAESILRLCVHCGKEKRRTRRRGDWEVVAQQPRWMRWTP
jgi:hypothetical protein